METNFRCKASDENCSNGHYGLGYCHFHWRRAKKGVPLNQPKIKRLAPECSVETCTHKPLAKDLCGAHYQQKYRGDEFRDVARYRECPIPDCGRNSKSAVTDLCKVHYKMSWRYSLTREDLIQMWTNAQCMNPGCGTRENLHVDHDHSCCDYSFDTKHKVSCGKCVRGLLCRTCNLGLGYMQEDPRRIKGLLVYLGLNLTS